MYILLYIFLLYQIENEKTKGKLNEIKRENGLEIENEKDDNNNNNKRPLQTPKIKKEELLKFVYDMSSENLNASTFKYAMRNLNNDQKEKEDYLLVNIKIIIIIFNF